jgi:UDP-GlcNAc:undecaprenyl-phosphate GlcNAc-1-phosphate transferase
MTVAILIPIVALGLPLMDTVLATLRRFIYGTKIFEPDKEHIHHRLLKLGYTPRRASLLLFAITILLGLTALLMENLRDDRTGLVLGALALMSILGIRKLGYLEYFTAEKILGWFSDVTDEAGIRRDRRTFLSNQVAIHGSDNIYQLWSRTVYAAEKINLSAVSLELNNKCFIHCDLPTFWWNNGDEANNLENGPERLMKIKLPLVSNGKCLGMFCVEKILHAGNDDRLVLRRIEHLRRTIISALERLLEKSLGCPEILQDRRNSCHPPTSDNRERSRNEITGMGAENEGGYSGYRDRRSFWKEEADKANVEKGYAEDKEERSKF